MAPVPSEPQAIRPLFDQISQSAATLTSDGTFPSDLERRNLIAAAGELVMAARSPEENIFAIAQQPAQNAALRCAIALAIPSALPVDGSPRSADELAAATGAEKTLLTRIIRACTSTAVFAESSEHHYAHNALSRTLLSAPNRALLTLMYDYNGRGIFALPEFLSTRQWRDPGSYADCAFMLGSRTKLPMWEYRDADAECRRIFDLGMQSEIVASLSTGKASGPFPFGEELMPAAKEKQDEENQLKREQVTIVDIGGGRGQSLEQIRHDHPELTGRFVLMDLAPVIESAIAAGLPSWIEPVAGSFFEPQLIRGARAYFIRRVLHNWDDEACRVILRNTAAAMLPSFSRLLITDMVVADVGAVREMAWEDLNMMTIGGVERTERQWRELLDECGLQIHKIWRNSAREHAVIEAWLK